MATTQSQTAMLPKAPSSDQLSFRTQWAAIAIRESLASVESHKNNAYIDRLLKANDTLFSGKDEQKTFRVGIVGAGAAGLFTAMIFDHLKEKYDLDVQYKILEGNDRVGGRLYSYYFPAKSDQPPIDKHDYYDVGAMRFPENKIMKRTFELFKVLNMEKPPWGQPSSPPPTPPKGGLIPYYMTGVNQPALYNNRQVTFKSLDQQLTANDFKIPGLPPHIAGEGSGKLIDDTIKEFTDEYKNHGQKAFWDLIEKKADKFSVREYLKKKYDYKTIEFLETLNYGNRWYDQALSEMILETMDFEPDPDADPKANYWWCIEGGAHQIALKMQETLKQKQSIELGKIVMAISYVDEQHDQVKVNVKGEEKPRIYDAVFNSAPLGAMQHMQLEGLELDWGTKSAIRSLGYGASCKVGVRFKSLWWIDKLKIKLGGQGKTDLPIRCCVYPSYNVGDPVDKPGVLLVSYTWSQEAEQIGSLITRESPAGEDELKIVLLDNLARLHTDNEKDYQSLHKLISDEYITHHAYNWYANPRSSGAFAYFGPEQFRKLYPGLSSADGKHVIIGEVASAHHAWVVGALESAVVGVYQFLYKHSHVSEKASQAAQGYSNREIGMPYGPLPAEYSRTKEDELPEGPSPEGELARLQVLIESIRLEQGGDEIDPDLIKKDQVDGVIGVGA